MTLWVVIENQRVTWTAFAIVAMFISKTVEILLICSFITKRMAKLLIFGAFTLISHEWTMLQITHIYGVKFFGLKIRQCKILDKYHVWLSHSVVQASVCYMCLSGAWVVDARKQRVVTFSRKTRKHLYIYAPCECAGPLWWALSQMPKFLITNCHLYRRCNICESTLICLPCDRSNL